jgi:glycosyltransferase involved in cell wall biosynthesis
LEETILSVLDQNYPKLEYIIIDGASTDNSIEIIKKYENKLSYWVSEKDNGMYDAIQKGFEKSTGDIMAWINADDLYHRKSLFIVAELFQKFVEINWLVGASTQWDEYGRGGKHLSE